MKLNCIEGTTAIHGFSVVIEEAWTLQYLLDLCVRERRIPADLSVNSIRRSLADSGGDLTMQLADPWTKQIWKIPARGIRCLHRECFDLETFLKVNLVSPPAGPGQGAFHPDEWDCPICGELADPRFLLIDDFLVAVRQALKEHLSLQTDAIVVYADGTWRLKGGRVGPRMEFDDDPGYDTETQLYGDDDDDDDWIEADS